jgi:hypothetical protein
MSVAAVALASVFSVVGTLTLVAVLWFCCRIKRKRTRADRDGQPKPSVLNIASFGRLDRKRFTTRDPGTDTQLDLMGSSDYDYTPSVSSRPRLPLSPVSPMSPLSQRPFSVADSDYQRPFTVHGRGSTASFEASSRPSTMYDTYPPRPVDARSRSSMFDDYYPSSPLSPMSPVDRPPGDHLGRQASIDELVSYPLMALAGDDADVQLKRETLAYLDSNVAGPSRRPQSLTEPEYLVHRDAGRLAGDGPRRIELPPRYEELDWDSEAASLPPGVDSPALSPIDARPLPTVASPALSPTRPLPDSKT